MIKIYQNVSKLKYREQKHQLGVVKVRLFVDTSIVSFVWVLNLILNLLSLKERVGVPAFSETTRTSSAPSPCFPQTAQRQNEEDISTHIYHCHAWIYMHQLWLWCLIQPVTNLNSDPLWIAHASVVVGLAGGSVGGGFPRTSCSIACNGLLALSLHCGKSLVRVTTQIHNLTVSVTFLAKPTGKTCLLVTLVRWYSSVLHVCKETWALRLLITITWSGEGSRWRFYPTCTILLAIKWMPYRCRYVHWMLGRS